MRKLSRGAWSSFARWVERQSISNCVVSWLNNRLSDLTAKAHTSFRGVGFVFSSDVDRWVSLQQSLLSRSELCIICFRCSGRFVLKQEVSITRSYQVVTQKFVFAIVQENMMNEENAKDPTCRNGDCNVWEQFFGRVEVGKERKTRQQRSHFFLWRIFQANFIFVTCLSFFQLAVESKANQYRGTDKCSTKKSRHGRDVL